MQASDDIQIWFSQLDRRVYALLVGAGIGLTGGIVGLMMATLGPVTTFGVVLGLLAGLYILTDIHAALYAIVAVMMLLPFGTLPFTIGFVPTFMDIAIGVFLMIYLLQWMTGQHQAIKLTPIHGLLAIYMTWLLLSFALGLRHSPPPPERYSPVRGYAAQYRAGVCGG